MFNVHNCHIVWLLCSFLCSIDDNKLNIFGLGLGLMYYTNTTNLDKVITGLYMKFIFSFHSNQFLFVFLDHLLVIVVFFFICYNDNIVAKECIDDDYNEIAEVSAIQYSVFMFDTTFPSLSLRIHFFFRLPISSLVFYICSIQCCQLPTVSSVLLWNRPFCHWFTY